MNFDDLMKDAWQGQAPPATPPDLIRRVHRKRHRQRLLRAAEVALTLVAVLVFGQALASDGMSPAHWLLLPFYLVFLPIVWAIVLRAPRRQVSDANECVSVYAHLRLAQLRTGLRDLWLARATGSALLGYALAANLGLWLLAGTHWRSPGLVLLAVAAVWLGATLWMSARLRRRWLREYRAVRRLTAA